MSQGVGVTTLHMVMYKLAVLTYAIAGLVIQFSLFFESPKYDLGDISWYGRYFSDYCLLLALSVSVNVQVAFVVISDKLFKSKSMRKIIDTCNTQIYSLRETVYSILRDRTAFYGSISGMSLNWLLGM